MPRSGMAKMPRRQFLASRVVAQAEEWICAAEAELWSVNHPLGLRLDTRLDSAPGASGKFEVGRAGMRLDVVHTMRGELLSIGVIRTNEKADGLRKH